MALEHNPYSCSTGATFCAYVQTILCQIIMHARTTYPSMVCESELLHVVIPYYTFGSGKHDSMVTVITMYVVVSVGTLAETIHYSFTISE